MVSNIRRLGILVALSGIMFLAVMLLVVSYSEVGVTEEIWAEELSLSADDLAAVPESVAEDAAQLSAELFGNSHEKYQQFVNQLLVTYVEAKDKDIVVVFNSGGWGWNQIDSSPGWSSILAGIESELDEFGYESLLLNYRRTSENLWACAKEFIEISDGYPSKTKYLASRVGFLVDHIPELRVIVAGESNGSVLSDCVMNSLQEKPQVYSIQTGTPFWHRTTTQERALVLNSNGTGPDAFCQGDILAMFNASAKVWFGLSSPEDRPGEILKTLQAPGHDYSWQYPEIYSEITRFIEDNFKIVPRQVS